jgi:hypothetical protein
MAEGTTNVTDPIRKVHLIFKTHLDIGFTDLAARVVENYFTRDIPRALETARQLRRAGGKEHFIWTTGSWLIYEYLERASASERQQMEEAILAGDIAWHALPFTTHTELMDAALFRFGLSLSQALDRRFGKKTIAGKMTDVPGHTRAMVPLLAEAGIEFLHIGVNPASTPPDVPPVFSWQDKSGASLIVMYHKGSYGDLMLVPGMDEAIAFAHTGDNLGPQSPEQVSDLFQHMRSAFPGARIVASTLNDYAAALRQVRGKLPVVTGELGDTWIHGAGSDPGKVAQFRELARLRNEWLASGKARPDDQRFSAFSRFLMLVPEHTWGLDIKTHLNDYANYDAAHFRAARTQPNFLKVESSWKEQRAYIDQALRALGDSPLAAEARHRLKAIAPSYPDLAGFEEIKPQDAIFDTSHLELRFDPEHGGITGLKDKATGRNWASAGQVLGQFRYERFSYEDYNRFWKQYIINKDRADVVLWAVLDFTKPGINTEHGCWLPQVKEMYQRRDKDAHRFLLILNGPAEAVTAYGCPQTLTMEITAPDHAPELQIDFQWFQKSACRLPEALWLSFVPKVNNPSGWTLHKLGQDISPLDVVRNGNRKLHGVWEGVTYHDGADQLAIESLDAALVAPGAPSLLDFNNVQPAMKGGMHFNLFNNVWGTNFTMWYEDDARFRFVLRLPGQ